MEMDRDMNMFEIGMIVCWAFLGIVVLYAWADIREMKKEVKSYRKDLMRNALGGRTSDNYEGFSEEEYWREAREAQEKDGGKAGRKGSAPGNMEEHVVDRCAEPYIVSEGGSAAKGAQEAELTETSGEAQGSGKPGTVSRTLTLKPGEEQVLREILLEFLS